MKREPNKKPREAWYYDRIFKRAVDEHGESFAWRRERYGAVIPYITAGNVLDLGCGLGVVADLIDNRQYLGIDFSPYAVRFSQRFTKNPNAKFRVGDLRAMALRGKWDTVLALELLEHVEGPAAMARLALRHARLRVIVTVPRDMRGRAHVWPTWTRADLEKVLGKLTVCELFGGDDNDRWWLAVRDLKP